MKKNVWSKLISLAMLAIALWLVGWDTPVKLAIGALIALAWHLMFGVHKREISDMRLTLNSMRDERNYARERLDAFRKENERLRQDYAALSDEKRDVRVPIDMTNLVEGIAYHIVKVKRGEEPRLDSIGVTLDGAIAAEYMDEGFRAEMVPVWILPDGRMAWRKKGRNSLEISIIRTLENAQ